MACLRHIANEILNTRIVGPDDEAHWSVFSPSNPLGQWEDQLLQSRGGECASPEIQDNELRSIKEVDLSSYPLTDACRNLSIL